MLLQSRRVDPSGCLQFSMIRWRGLPGFPVERAPHAAAHVASPILHAFKESGELQWVDLRGFVALAADGRTWLAPITT